MLDRILRDLAVESSSATSGRMRRTINRLMRVVVGQSFEDALRDTTQAPLFDRVIENMGGESIGSLRDILRFASGGRASNRQTDHVMRSLLQMAEQAGATAEDLQSIDFGDISRTISINREGHAAVHLSQIPGLSEKMQEVFRSFEASTTLPDLAKMGASATREHIQSRNDAGHVNPRTESLANRFANFVGVTEVNTESMSNVNDTIERLIGPVEENTTALGKLGASLTQAVSQLFSGLGQTLRDGGKKAFRISQRMTPEFIRRPMMRAGARLGAQLAPRLGISTTAGMRGGAALGSVGAAAVPIAVVAGLGFAAVTAAKALKKLGTISYETALNVAHYNGELAHSKALLEIGNIRREISMANTIGPWGSSAIDEHNRFSDNIAPIKEMLGAGGAMIETGMYKAVNGMLESLGDLVEINENTDSTTRAMKAFLTGGVSEAIQYLQKILEVGENKKGGKDGTPVEQMFNQMLFNPKPKQPLVKQPALKGGP